jgi:hypothetical protein
VPDWTEIFKQAEPYIKTGGEVAGKIAAGRAQGRAAENLGSQAQDRTAIERYQAEQLARLAAANLTESATKDRADRFLTDAETRARQVGLGDVMANVQDVHLGGLPSYIPHMSFSGGLRPSALGANARAAGQNLSRMALEAQLSGADIPNLPDVSGLGGAAPELTPLQQSGKLDTLLSMLGYAGMGAGAIEEAGRQRRAGAPSPESGIPRYDTSAGVGTNVPLSALDPNTGMATAGRGNILRMLAAAAQRPASGGGYTE